MNTDRLSNVKCRYYVEIIIPARKKKKNSIQRDCYLNGWWHYMSSIIWVLSEAAIVHSRSVRALTWWERSHVSEGKGTLLICAGFVNIGGPVGTWDMYICVCVCARVCTCHFFLQTPEHQSPSSVPRDISGKSEGDVLGASRCFHAVNTSPDKRPALWMHDSWQTPHQLEPLAG